jgi:hypothetical protein
MKLEQPLQNKKPWVKKVLTAVLGLGTIGSTAQAQKPKPINLSQPVIKNVLNTQKITPESEIKKQLLKNYPKESVAINKEITPITGIPTSKDQPLAVTKDSKTGLTVNKDGTYVVDSRNNYISPITPDQKVIKVDLSSQEVSSDFSLEPGIITEVESTQENSTLTHTISSFGSDQNQARALNHEKHRYPLTKIQSLEIKSPSGAMEGTYVFEYLKANNLLNKCLTLADLRMIQNDGIKTFDELLEKYNVTEIFAFSSADELLGQITPDGRKSRISVPVLTKINGEMTLTNRDMEGYQINKVFIAVPPDDYSEPDLTTTK